MTIGVSGSALAHNYIEGSGAKFTYLRRPDGSVELRQQNRVIKLTTTCHASSNVDGDGSWAWANGGFIIELSNKRFGFPMQELEIDTVDGGCRM